MVTLDLIAYLASIVYQAGFIEERFDPILAGSALSAARLNRLKQYTKIFLLVREKLINLGDLKESERCQKLILEISRSQLEISWNQSHWQTFAWFCLFILQNESNDIKVKETDVRSIHAVVHILSLLWLFKSKIEPKYWGLKVLSRSESIVLFNAYNNSDSSQLGLGLSRVFSILHEYKPKLATSLNLNTSSVTSSEEGFFNSPNVARPNLKAVNQLRIRQKARNLKLQSFVNNFATHAVGLLIAMLFILLFLINRDTYEMGFALWHCLFGGFFTSVFVLLVLGSQRLVLRRLA